MKSKKQPSMLNMTLPLSYSKVGLRTFFNLMLKERSCLPWKACFVIVFVTCTIEMYGNTFYIGCLVSTSTSSSLKSAIRRDLMEVVFGPVK